METRSEFIQEDMVQDVEEAEYVQESLEELRDAVKKTKHRKV